MVDQTELKRLRYLIRDVLLKTSEGNSSLVGISEFSILRNINGMFCTFLCK